jgi:hypothetical protein
MKYRVTAVREVTILDDLSKLGPEEEWVYDYIDDLLIEVEAAYVDAGPSKQTWHFLSFREEEHNMGWYISNGPTVKEYGDADTVVIVNVEVKTKSWNYEDV